MRACFNDYLQNNPDFNRKQIKCEAYQIEMHNATCLESLFPLIMRVWQDSWNGFTNSYNITSILPYRDFSLFSRAIFLYEFVQGIQLLVYCPAVWAAFGPIHARLCTSCGMLALIFLLLRWQTLS
jgi:hypothetical protein